MWARRKPLRNGSKVMGEFLDHRAEAAVLMRSLRVAKIVVAAGEILPL
jgi:hypothetical protein